MGFMDIIRKIGNPFKGLLQLPRIVKRVEPEEFVYGYDLYSEMPDGLLGARTVSYTHLTLPTTYGV